jgi:hypothetical protein
MVSFSRQKKHLYALDDHKIILHAADQLQNTVFHEQVLLSRL